MIKYLLPFLFISTNAYSVCQIPTPEDDELAIANIIRNCRIDKVKLESSLVEGQVDQAAQRRLNAINAVLETNPHTLKYERDISTRNTNQLGLKNRDLIDKNKKVIKAQRKYLTKIDKNAEAFVNEQLDTNDRHELMILRNFEYINESIAKQAQDAIEIDRNLNDIDTNRKLIDSQHMDNLGEIQATNVNRVAQIKELYQQMEILYGSIQSMIDSRLNNICSALRYCGDPLSGAISANSILDLTQSAGDLCQMAQNNCSEPAISSGEISRKDPTMSSQIGEGTQDSGATQE